MRKKVRLIRRGNTTVSNASMRMTRIRTMPAIDAHQCMDESEMTPESYQIQGMTLRGRVRRVQRLPDGLQFFQQAAQIARVERVGAVALRFFRIVVDFHEH